jgi:hypothetical protein
VGGEDDEAGQEGFEFVEEKLTIAIFDFGFWILD